MGTAQNAGDDDTKGFKMPKPKTQTEKTPKVTNSWERIGGRMI